MFYSFVYIWNRDLIINCKNLILQAETDATKSGVRPQSAPIESGAKKKSAKKDKDAK